MLLRSYSFEKYKSKNFLFSEKIGPLYLQFFVDQKILPHDPKIFFPDIKSKDFNVNPHEYKSVDEIFSSHIILDSKRLWCHHNQNSNEL